MTKVKVYLSNNPLLYNPLLYIWDVFCRNKGIQYVLTNNKAEGELIIDETETSDIAIAIEFYKLIASGNTKHISHFSDTCTIRDSKNNPDYLATAFYMINSIQEHNENKFDELGRFEFVNSYQYKFKNIQENLVQYNFDELERNCKKLQGLTTVASTKTNFFLSHDIDSINGALLQDGLVALKQFNPAKVLSLLFNAAMQKPDWLNMNKIMQMESAYDFKSAFFWLVNKGKINQRETNSDYSINKNYIKNAIQNIHKTGFENGLHKSISNDTFAQELKKMPIATSYNRYHYLKFRLPEAYHDIENSGLTLDASLGFAEVFGFRNNYGKPFRPYNFKDKKSFNFIEVPLNVMDGTFQRYMKVPMEKTADTIISFFEKNKNNCTISVLWHNTFFSNYKYKGYPEQYKKVLQYLYDSKYQNITLEKLSSTY